jgi:hypothetical protein
MPYLKGLLDRAGDILAEPVQIGFWDMISQPDKA